MINSENSFDSSQLGSIVSSDPIAAYSLEATLLGDSFQETTAIAVDPTEDIVADDGLTSLREAIDYTNTTYKDVLILLSEGTYTRKISQMISFKPNGI